MMLRAEARQLKEALAEVKDVCLAGWSLRPRAIKQKKKNF
jgi:hypothetical protein